jgi:mono/diheme cytochrome c family protein
MKYVIYLLAVLFSFSSLSQNNNDYGLQVYKKGNCKSCHYWHGGGGVSYGGVAMSLRDTALEKEDLIKLIECGRPGTNMPYFSKKAYKDDRCFGLTFKDFEGVNNDRPLAAKVKLNDRQIKAVVDFIVTKLKNKPLTKEYCINYFGKPTKACEKIK